MKVIGLGTAGCNIADQFARFPQYKVYKLNEGEEKSKNCYNMPKVEAIDEYEAASLNLKTFFRGLRTNDDVMLIVCGAAKVSAATLKVLEHIKRCRISVLYIRPDRTLLSKDVLMHERVAFHVLQEYARSGVFEKTYLIDNRFVEKVLDNVPILGYYERLNELIVNTIHMTNVFANTDSVYSTPNTPLATARISTFGIVDIEKDEEKLLFPLDTINERCYIYAINRKQLETDGELFTALRDRSAKMVDDETTVSVQIHSTEYEDNYGYIIASTSETQQET